jgi:hypothetical protein
MSHEADGRSRDEVLGPPLCRIYERSAVRPPPPNAPAPPSLRIFALRAFSVGGCGGSVGRPRSSTIIRTLHSPYRVYSRQASEPPF